MKWVFLVVVLILLASGLLMGAVVASNWTRNFANQPKLMPGEEPPGGKPLLMPAGTLPRTGGELARTLEQGSRMKNPVTPTPESVARGKPLYAIYCAPCHGPEGAGDGPVGPKFIPATDLRQPATQQKSDGYLAHYIGHGGAIMPAYGEAISVEERWDIVNYVRSLAAR
ncbi:MAG: cytochrome c [Candidatus Rokubacteria bacterium]|nr:cytochrome c [Candidatus Rokubacteria bacterium]